MRIHFTYRTIDAPWGGANNFMRALKAHLRDSGDVELTERLGDPADILFMNQLGQGPGANGRKLSLRQVRQARADGRRLVVRAVNLQRHAFRLGPRNLILGYLHDRATLRLLEMADAAVFQSAYQRDVFTAAGYRGGSNVIIHNGAAPDYWNTEPPAPLPDGGRLRIVSATASPRASKRHAVIAEVSRLPGVEVMHCGAWPKGVDTANVTLLGKLPREDLAQLYKTAHLFLHPAVKDPCPNAIFEAICSGLPVLYNAGPGSSAEIVGANGLPLNLDDPGETVATARRDLDALRDRVRGARSHYTIQRAAGEYRALFDREAAALGRHVGGAQ